MCLILFAVNEHPEYPLVLAANRDEFLQRPTAPAGWWNDNHGTLGGRDLKAGGTWLGITRSGRLAAVTNVREPGVTVEDARSRGELVTAVLHADRSPEALIPDLDGRAYNGFNLMSYQDGVVVHGTNRGDVGAALPAVNRVASGIHGLSNATLDTPWPKVVEGRIRLSEALRKLEPGRIDWQPFLDLLAASDPAPDSRLPQTGVPLELERALSSSFIRTGGYGTRCSTVVLISADGTCHFLERSYPSLDGSRFEDRTFTLPLQAKEAQP
ncbi:MAG: NRDE family protein [Rhodothermales bacterium]|nr:NRDE family protein [Rhodothermales bacterium]